MQHRGTPFRHLLWMARHPAETYPIPALHVVEDTNSLHRHLQTECLTLVYVSGNVPPGRYTVDHITRRFIV